jgi:hypothetical protein
MQSLFGMKTYAEVSEVRRIAEAFYGSYYAVDPLLVNDAAGAMPWVYIASQKPSLLAMLYLQATPPRRGCLVVNVFRWIDAPIKDVSFLPAIPG